MASNPPQACGRCHAGPNEADDPARLGLKGAYHRQCIGCHERQLQPAPAPTECSSCHHPWTPDHAPLVTLADHPAPQAVTRACLECHPKTGQDLLGTAHWNWKGQSPTLAGYENRTDVSLQLMVNNYCIAIGSNQYACATCHIGYGWMDSSFDFSDPTQIDCLVCHDTTGTYRKNPLKAGMPDPGAGPGGHRPEGGTAVAAGLRFLPFLQRRGPQRQARRPRAGPGGSARRPRLAHGRPARCAARTATPPNATGSPGCPKRPRPWRGGSAAKNATVRRRTAWRGCWAVTWTTTSAPSPAKPAISPPSPAPPRRCSAGITPRRAAIFPRPRTSSGCPPTTNGSGPSLGAWTRFPITSGLTAPAGPR